MQKKDKKRIILAIVLLTGGLMLQGCRYHLRGTAGDMQVLMSTPTAIKTTQPNSPFIKTLRQNLKAVHTALVPVSDAVVVLAVLDHELIQNTKAISSNTQIRKHTLTFTVNYQILNSAMDPLQETKSLNITRSYTTDDNQMLGASHEKWQIERSMHQEASYQLLNQLRAVISELAVTGE